MIDRYSDNKMAQKCIKYSVLSLICVMGLSNVFSVTAVLLFVSAFFFFRYVDSHVKNSRYCIIISLFFALILVICESFRDYNGLDAFKVADKVDIIWYITGCWIAIYYLLRFIMHIINICVTSKPVPLLRFAVEHPVMVSFLTIIAFWSPSLIINYPGTFNPDSFYQMQQYFGEFERSTQQPFFSTFLMGTCISVGDFFIDRNFGVFLYVLLQSVLGALVFAECIKWLHDIGCTTIGCIAVLCFYSAIPFWGRYAQWFEKDFLFSVMITLFSLLIAKSMHDKKISGKRACLIFIVAVLCALLRNNGIYVVLPTLVGCVVCMHKSDKRKALEVAVGVGVCFFLIQNIAISAGHLKTGYKQEMLSIPFQQTARYVVAYPDDVTNEEKRIIDSVIDYDAIIANYSPETSDPIKNTYRWPKEKCLKEYYVVWAKMFFKHPGVYISSFVNMNYGFLAPVELNGESSYTFKSEWETSHGIYKIFPEKIITCWDKFILTLITKTPILSWFCAPGLYTWIVGFLIIPTLKSKKQSLIVLMIPYVLSILICLASPLAISMRYMLPVVASLPILIGMFIKENRSFFELEIL